MLDFDSEDIDDMDDDAGDDQEPAPTGHWNPPQLTMYIWWIHLTEAITRNNGTLRRIIPSKSSQNGDVSAA